MGRQSELAVPLVVSGSWPAGHSVFLWSGHVVMSGAQPERTQLSYSDPTQARAQSFLAAGF